MPKAKIQISLQIGSSKPLSPCDLPMPAYTFCIEPMIFKVLYSEKPTPERHEPQAGERLPIKAATHVLTWHRRNPGRNPTEKLCKIWKSSLIDAHHRPVWLNWSCSAEKNDQRPPTLQVHSWWKQTPLTCSFNCSENTQQFQLRDIFFIFLCCALFSILPHSDAEVCHHPNKISFSLLEQREKAFFTVNLAFCFLSVLAVLCLLVTVGSLNFGGLFRRPWVRKQNLLTSIQQVLL